MNSEQCCSICSREIPDESPEGLCPACVLVTALASDLTQFNLTERHEETGHRFGPYTTVRILGEGGMGIVYLSRQEQPVRRTVALKVIKPGMDSRQVITRFESERQALALMDHPNIARFFDAGASESGQAYFAMEYIPGTPLLEYCDTNRLRIPERLDLFCDVCLAVHHAHHKGIVHRDLKPSNVLIAVHDGEPVPKVIDFGVAKATHQRLTERTVFTEEGLLIGTPEYMSPEQASMTDHDVDASTDIYSLGVLLYELIAGVLPFDAPALRRAGYLELRRAIVEQEFPTPAARLRGLGEAAQEIARRRQTDVRSLERQVRGDLEWITIRALEKDRSRRYASSSEFAADITRHLNHEPVLASPPNPVYRLRKFIRKHRVGAGLAAAILICLLAGVTVSTALYFREQRQRDLAERQGCAANLANADSLIEAAEVETARNLLFQCPPHLRGWEWRLLYARSDTSVAKLRGTGDSVPPGQIRDMHFAFAPDHTRLYFHMHRTVHAWDIPAWAPVANSSVFGPILGMSPDGSRIVTRALRLDDPDLLVLNPASGQRITTLRGNHGALTAAFNATGDRIATGSADGSLRLWNANDGNLLASASPVERPLPYPRIAFSPDGRYIAFSAVHLLRLLDARDLRFLRGLRCRSTIFAVAFSPDGRHILTSDGTATIRTWSIPSGEAELAWANTGVAFAAVYSPDGAALVTASQNGLVRVYETASGSAVATLTGPTADLEAVTFSPDAKWILAGSDNGDVWVWDAPTYGGTVLSPASRAFTAIAVTRDGSHIAANTLEGTIVDAVSGRRARREWPAAHGLAFSPAGDRLAAGDFKGGVHVFDVMSGSVVLDLPGHTAAVQSVAFSPDGRFLATGSWDGTTRLWDAAKGAAVATINLSAHINGIAFSPDGKLLATGAGGPLFASALTVWEVPSARVVHRFLPPHGIGETITAVAFDSRGRLAAAESFTGRIRLIDMPRWEFTARFNDDANVLAFSPDGKLLASGGYDGRIHLWDTARGVPTLIMQRISGQVHDLAFSPDGTKLYACYDRGPLRVWSVETAYPPDIREQVARIQREHPAAPDVWRLVKNDPTLNEAQRTAALQLSSWRLNSDPNLREHLWGAVVNPTTSEAERKLLLQRAESLYDARPLSVEAWTILGAAQYRNGLLSEAVRNLARASAVACDDPRADAFLAMALYSSRQTGIASEALSRARPLLRDAEPIPQHDGTILIAEAEALLAGKPR